MQFRERLRQILSIRESPHRIAIAFAVGIFIGMSPLLGVHTVLGIAAAWLFRLNRVVTLIGVYVTNPWTIVPIYTFCTWVGARLLGIRDVIPDIEWGRLSVKALASEFGHLAMPFVVGTTLVGLVSAMVGYAVIYRAVKRDRE
ncbi:MAG: DUF2062 domain-containing protein [Thermodesulfovibrionales bacterium]